jgi:hypothetical protein
VYPPDYKGERQQPAFTDSRRVLHRLVALDNFKPIPRACSQATRSSCTPASTRTTASDTAAASARCRAARTSSRKRNRDKPIVIKAAGDGEAIFDGDSAYNLFNVMAANYNYFEG